MAMVFPTSPTVGQVFSSGGRSWVWTGSTWDSPAGQPFIAPGSTLVASAVFTSQTSVSFNNILTSVYDVYEIYMSVQGTAAAGVNLRLRAGGTDLTTNSYRSNNVLVLDAAVSGGSTGLIDSWNTVPTRNTGVRQGYRGTVINPARSGVQKNYLYNAFDWTGGSPAFYTGGGHNTTTTAFDGFSFIAGSGTMTGEIFIYGLRK
jgi:hypothetical protein